ncbi:MAG: hypothetical protein ACFFC3_07315 [Candidatus Odinarchaeota archaeon]
MVMNTPVIIGAAQITQRKDVDQPLDPLTLIANATKKAIAMSGTDELRDAIDTLYMSTISSWSYEDASENLSNILGIKPIQQYTAPISGNVPQLLVNKAAKAISLNKNKVILIAGGEASYSKYRADKEGITLNWPEFPIGAIDKIHEATNFYSSKFEINYRLANPIYPYALIETALRAQSGRSLKEHLDNIGMVYERFSKIATANPYAWEQNHFKAEEIITPKSDNRIICHPYTKRMVANLYVDQAAALILTNEKIANKLSINRKLWVYPMGGADIYNIHYITQRPKLYNSPAIREASKLALKQAGLNLSNIDAFDLYSCFPCMVEIARQEIGIPEDDPRDLTITGGLSFFGGPLSSYSMHAIVTAIDIIQKNPSKKIMILANGGFNTSESVGIYGSDPPAIEWARQQFDDIQQKIEAKILPELIEKANGNFTIEAYTIIYDRKGLPEYGVVIGSLQSGERTLAFISEDFNKLMSLEEQELIGKTYSIKYDPGGKINKLLI